MKKSLIHARLAPWLLILAGCTSSVEECILERAPKAETDDEAKVVLVYCQSRYERVAQGSGLGLGGYSSPQDCLNSKGDGVKSIVAFSMIRASCRKLYDKPVDYLSADPNAGHPNVFDQFDKPAGQYGKSDRHDP